MDRKEAIRVLEEFQVIDDWTIVHLPPMEDAVSMAIEALEKYDECVEALKEMLELKAEPKCKQCLYNPEHPFTVNCSEFPTGSDLISRQDAILVVKDYLRDNYIEDADWHGDGIERELYALPSAEVKAESATIHNNGITFSHRKTGKWIEVEVFPEVYDIEGVKTWGSKMQCDQCGFRFTAIEGHITQYNFCPNCGADMRGEE